MTNTHRESVNDISQQEETRQKWNAIVKNEYPGEQNKHTRRFKGRQ